MTRKASGDRKQLLPTPLQKLDPALKCPIPRPLQVAFLPHLSLAMGIKGLTALIKEHAPHAIKETDIKACFGRAVAIDA